MEIKVLPTVFVYDALALEERLELYETITDMVQLDVADSEFTSQPTLEIEMMIEQPTTLKRDLHMMINEPIEWLEAVAESAVEMVTGQIEMMSNQGEFVTEAKRLNLRVGLALDLETKLEELDWQITETVDQILIMAVRAGKEEQSFNKDALEKILKLRKMGFDKNICVDGAVGEKTIKACVKAGANILAVGSSLWRAEDVGIQLKKLQQLAETP